MADLVGEAFIRITADTTPMRRAVKRAANQAGSEWTSEFGKEVEATADANLRRARAQLAEALVDPKGFDRMRKQFDSTSDAAANFRGQLEDLSKAKQLNKREFDTLTVAINNWEKQTNRAEEAARRLADQQERESEAIRKFEEGVRKVAAARKDENEAIERALVNARKLAAEREKQVEKDISLATENEKAQIRAAENVAAARKKLADQEVADLDRRVAAQRRALDTYSKNIDFTRQRDALREQAAAFDSYADNIDRSARRIRRDLDRGANPAILRMGRGMERFNDHLRHSGNTIGRVFGKGSRNNFLNLFGRSIEALTTGPIRILTGAFAKVTSTVGEMISAFRLVRLDGGSMFAALGASGRSLLGSLAAGVPGLIAAAAAVAGLAVVLPAAVSGMFLLAGALTAVAGAITQALLGSLLPLLPLLAGVAAGAGALFIAFKNGAKDGSKAEKVLKGMGTELKKFVRIFREDTNRLFETFASGLPQVLERIQPVIKGAFAGLQGAAEGFFRSLQTDRARRVLKELGATVENVLTPLGSLIGDTFVALSAFFNELEPYTTRMLNAFDDLMVRFGRWATSAEGKNSIKTFMDDAFLAADKVWDILGNLVGALGAVFGVSQEKAGQDFLSYLVTITEQFETFVKSADGKPKVEAFFTDVRATMVSVKDVLEELGNTLDALDTETSRQDFQTFLDVLHAFAEAARFVSAAFEPIGIALKNLDSPLKGLVEISKWAFDQLFGNSWIVDIVKGFEEWIPRIPRAIISGLAGVGERLVGPFSDAWTRLTGLLSPISERVGAFLSGIPGRIRSALASVASRFSEPFSTAKARLSARIAEIRSTVSSRVSGIPGVVSTALRGLASAFSTPFRAAWEVVSGWVSTIRRLIDSLLGKASSAKSTIGGVIANISRNIPMASGGVVYGPTNALIGEAGREAVVPLDRPLARVDKSVRGLAAIAQGRASFGSGGIAGGSSITIAEGAIVIQTSSTNPRIIAEQVIDRLTAEARR